MVFYMSVFADGVIDICQYPIDMFGIYAMVYNY